MYRSSLLMLCLYGLIGLTFAIAGTTNSSIDSVSAKTGLIPNHSRPITAHQDNIQVVPLPSRNFGHSQAQEELPAEKCYVRYRKTDCLNFPSRPHGPRNSNFVYHGLHGVFEYHG